MTFEWKRASRVVAVVPVSSFIDFCPEIQDGRVGWTTNSTKTKQIFGLRSRVREVFPRDKTRMSSWNRRTTATNTGLLSELKIARSLWLPSLLYVMHAVFLSPTMHPVPYNLAMNDDFYPLNRTPWRHWGKRRRRGPGVNFKCKKVLLLGDEQTLVAFIFCQIPPHNYGKSPQNNLSALHEHFWSKSVLIVCDQWQQNS